MTIKAMEVTELGTVFAVYDEQMQLILADRDRAEVEAALERVKEGAGLSDKPPAPPKVDVVARLNALTQMELRALAKEQAIPGFFKMSNVNLKDALKRKLEAPADDVGSDGSKPDDDSGVDGELDADNNSDPTVRQKDADDGQ